MNALSAPEVEKTALGLVILHNDNFPVLLSEVMPDDFSLDSHRKLYRAMMSVSEDGKEISPITLMDRLGANKELASVGGVAYISSLTEGCLGARKIEHYCRIIKDRSRRRALHTICTRGLTLSEDGSEDTSSCISAVQADLLDISAESGKQTVLHASQITDQAFSELAERRQSTLDIIGLPTGLDELDSSTDGIQAQDFWVVGARPGRGKSAFATQVMQANVTSGHPVQMFSVEMTRQQVFRRLWARVGNVPFRKLKDPRRADEYEWQRISSAAGKVAQWPLWVDDSSGISIDELIARGVLAVKRHKVELVIVDYLQNVRCDSEDDEVQRISTISRRLTAFAKDYCPVIALSQLPRAPEHNINKIPNMQDLKGSSQIEQDAHVILFLHRPQDQETKLFTGEDLIIIEKQREGEVGMLPMYFDGDTMTYKPRGMR